MFKLGAILGAESVQVDHPAVFEHESTGGTRRLRIAVPGAGPNPLHVLLKCLNEPFVVLYVLHTPRTGEAGRYESPQLSRASLLGLLSTYADFLAHDSRHDLWVHSHTPEATLAWDHHDILYAYGPLSRFEQELAAAGFAQGTPTVPNPHRHHFHAEFDRAEAALVGALDWQCSPLEPEDGR